MAKAMAETSKTRTKRERARTGLQEDALVRANGKGKFKGKDKVKGNSKDKGKKKNKAKIRTRAGGGATEG